VPKSNYLENELINHVFRTATFSKPSAIYVALYTVTPSDAGGGTECSGGGYARVSVPPLNANWDATSGSDGKTANTAAVTFPTPSGSWGSIVAFAILDASSGGNFLYWGPLTNAKTVNNGDPAPKFNIGQLTVTEA
tara:strand:- start:1081 stop:1488 length:408 start_codon:yes stop_codon:yes gene_type:complete